MKWKLLTTANLYNINAENLNYTKAENSEEI